MKRGAILATNTSTLDVDAIAAFTKRPGDVLGLHFFSPANVMRLLEVVRAKKTRPDVLATAMSVARKIGKTAVVAGRLRRLHRQSHDQPVFAAGVADAGGGRVPAADRPRDREFGFAMGPFRMSDLAGNDISWHIRKRHYAEHPKHAAHAHRRSHLRARPLRAEDRARLVSLRSRASAMRFRIRSSTRSSTRNARRCRSRRARLPTRRSSTGWCSRW